MAVFCSHFEKPGRFLSKGLQKALVLAFRPLPVELPRLLLAFIRVDGWEPIHYFSQELLTGVSPFKGELAN